MGGGCPRLFADGRGVWRQDGPGQEPWGVWWHDIEAVVGSTVEDCAGGHTFIELVYDVEDSVCLRDFWPGFGRVARAISDRIPGIRPGWLQEVRRREPGAMLYVWERAEPHAGLESERE